MAAKLATTTSEECTCCPSPASPASLQASRAEWWRAYRCAKRAKSGLRRYGRQDARCRRDSTLDHLGGKEAAGRLRRLRHAHDGDPRLAGDHHRMRDSNVVMHRELEAFQL